jgi:hypothetical protein
MNRSINDITFKKIQDIFPSLQQLYTSANDLITFCADPAALFNFIPSSLSFISKWLVSITRVPLLNNQYSKLIEELVSQLTVHKVEHSNKRRGLGVSQPDEQPTQRSVRYHRDKFIESFAYGNETLQAHVIADLVNNLTESQRSIVDADLNLADFNKLEEVEQVILTNLKDTLFELRKRSTDSNLLKVKTLLGTVCSVELSNKKLKQKAADLLGVHLRNVNLGIEDHERVLKDDPLHDKRELLENQFPEDWA